MCSLAVRVRALSVAALVAWHLSLAGTAAAGPIVNFATGLALSMQQNSTGSMAVQVRNDGDAPQNVDTCLLAIMLVQKSGSGTLTLDSWTKPGLPLLVGGANADYAPPAMLTLNAPVTIGGTEYFNYHAVSVAANPSQDFLLLAGETKNVGLMTFSSVGQGAWDVYVVNQAPPLFGLPVSVLQDSLGSDFGFGNLASTDGAFLKIGTVTAVPEPSTLVLAGIAAAGTLLPVVRRRLQAQRQLATA